MIPRQIDQPNPGRRLVGEAKLGGTPLRGRALKSGEILWGKWSKTAAKSWPALGKNVISPQCGVHFLQRA